MERKQNIVNGGVKLVKKVVFLYIEVENHVKTIKGQRHRETGVEDRHSYKDLRLASRPKDQLQT